MAPVPAVSRTMPEEDRPEHIGWGGPPIKTCPVAVVARPVDGGEHHQGRYQKDQQGDHPDVYKRQVQHFWHRRNWL